MAMLPKKLGFMRLPELDQVAMFKAKLASFLPNMAKVTSSQTRMFPGFSGNMAISLSQALGQRLLCCPKRGTYVPPFLK